MSDLLYMGGNVKALGGGKVAGYLIQYSDAAHPDLSREKDFFTADCDYDLDTGNKKSVFYAHGLDAKMGVKRIGIGEVKQDDVGVWIEAQLSLADEYSKAIYALAEKGRLGWSSGAPSHLVTRKAIETDAGTVHEIKTWPLAEASLTPCPADHRNQAIALKSLPALIGIHPEPENHTKALPAGMSYDDLRQLLNDELNEDFPDDDDDPGGWNPGYYIRDIYDDAVVYSDEEDLFRRTYQVTAGNDVVWGPEESVVRVTTYATASDVDDTAEDGQEQSAPMSMMKEVKTESAPATLPFGEHLDTALAAVAGVIERGFDINDLRIKSGRVLSAANRSKLKDMHTQMQTAHAAMASHIAKMGDLLTATDPDAKKDAEDFAALRTQFVRLKSELLHLSG